MSRKRWYVGEVLAVIVLVPFVLAGCAPSAGVPETGGNAVQVSLTEFSVDMLTELPAGPTRFEVANDGAIEHNFEVEGQGVEATFDTNLAPGETRTLDVDLAPGTYEVYCPVDGHRDEGMQVQLTVGGG